MRPQTTVQYVPRKANGAAHRIAQFCLRESAYHFGWMMSAILELDYSWIAFEMIFLLCIHLLDFVVISWHVWYSFLPQSFVPCGFLRESFNEATSIMLILLFLII
ncbi:unnamed protein product [Prunus brigantina]